MNKYLTVISCSAIILAACNGGEKKTEINTAIDSNSVSIPAKPAEHAKECFSKINGKDTVTLSYTTVDNKVAGQLMYNYFEKDKNSGTIDGILSGDTLFVDYTFKSEGMMSVREVVFVKKGNTLVEGYGDGQEKDGKWVFKNRSELKFDNSAVLQKVNCSE